jgi:NTE family protein
MSCALVLAGGGLTGIAWETGVLLGLHESGVDLTCPDLVVGTSAGSTVGAQLLSGVDLDELFARQVSDEHQELTPEVDLERLLAFFTEAGDPTGAMDQQAVRRVGRFAKEAVTVPVERRREVICWRLPSHDWPATRLLVTAVDADTGELLVLDRESGVTLVDAVAASCAVPGVWPPVPLLGRTLIDGGVLSPAHLELAIGYDEVLALLPWVGPGLMPFERDADALRASGSHVRVVVADEKATEAMGLNALDPSRRPAAARAGRRQGLAAADLFA